MADFVDTNVLVYAFDNDEPVKQARAREVLRERPDAVISTQVMLEWHSVVTRKFEPPLTAEAARAGVAALSGLEVVPADAELVVRAAETAVAHRMSIWDAMIIESASLAGCARLLTEDLSDGTTIRGVTVHNPFAPEDG